MRVGLFITCLADQLYPEVGVSVVQLLRRHGCEVGFPAGQVCCGQPAFNSGYAGEAREVARGLLDAFEGYDYVVSPSGSCGGMVHHYYPELFAGDEKDLPRALSLKGRLYEFSQFMVRVLKVRGLGGNFPHRITYHPSCHGTRILGVKDEPLELLKQVRGIEFVPLAGAEDCCGFGGTFAVKMGDISGAMVQEKVQHIAETGAEYVVGTDMGCLMNIAGRMRRLGLPVQALHLAQVLHQSVSGGPLGAPGAPAGKGRP